MSERDYLDRLKPSNAQLRADRQATLYRREREADAPTAEVVPLWLVRQRRRGVKSTTDSLRFGADPETRA